MKYLVIALCISATECFGECSPTLPQSTPNNQFSVHEAGVVTDSAKGLMWMRCSLGQNWTGNTCEGEPREVIWSAAVTIAVQTNFATFNDWRLPNKNELNSIVETACAFPSTNENVFPGTINNAYWTSSPYDDESKHIWIIRFDNGSVFPYSASNTATVRLVRDVVN